MATTTPDQASEGGNKRSRDDASSSPPIKRVKKDEERAVGDEKEQEEPGSTNSLFGSPATTSQECTICLEAFHEQEGEEKILEPCGHLFCAECWELWATFLERVMRVEVRCPTCREVVKGVDDWLG